MRARFLGMGGNAQTDAVAPPTPFYPATFPDPLFIVDAIQSPFTDSGGAYASQWNDLSGNNNHAIQPTLANQLQYLATGLNGLPTFQTLGTPQGFNFTTPIATGPMTVYAVMEVAGTGFNTFLYAPSGPQVFWGVYSTAAKFELVATGFSDWNSSFALNVASLLTATCTNVPAANAIRVYTKGVAQGLTANTGDVTANHFTEIGSADSAPDWFIGKYSFIGIYGSVHDLATRTLLNDYLISRWTL